MGIVPQYSRVMAGLEKSIVDGAHDAVIYAGRDGIIRLWNAAAARMLGHSEDEAVGQSLDVIIPEKHRQRHWSGYQRVMETGETAYTGSLLAVPALHADGSRVSVEFTVTLVKDDAGAVEGIAAIMRDVTQRRESERALRRELTELREKVGSGDSAG